MSSRNCLAYPMMYGVLCSQRLEGSTNQISGVVPLCSSLFSLSPPYTVQSFQLHGSPTTFFSTQQNCQALLGSPIPEGWSRNSLQA